MSEYSETIGSFSRTGNYPLESNYIFDSYEKLIEFYEDPLNKATLHIGLTKVVLNEDGSQSLYWVTGNEELQFVELIKNTTTSELTKSIEQINNTINKPRWYESE